MVQLIYDILPPKARRFYSRNAGRIKLAMIFVTLGAFALSALLLFTNLVRQKQVEPA